MKKLNVIKAFAVDIDGVLVKDTFSPVLKRVFEKFGGIYTAEVENNLFSKSQIDGARFTAKYLNLDESPEDLIKIYFQERKNYIHENPDKHGIVDGIETFLTLLSSYNKRMVCYGGLNKDYFKHIIGEYAHYFEEYICTNEIRPGIHEIIKDYFQFEYKEVLFFDDVNSVALEAIRLGVPFIGVSSQYNGIGFQAQEMKKSGVKYIVNSVNKIDEELLEKVSLDFYEPKK